METFTLRPATSDDLAIVHEIEMRNHVAPWAEENFRFELTKPYSHFLLMTDDETDSKIAGYIVYWLLFDDCQVLNVVVDLPYRGLGMAKKMLRQAAQAALKKEIKKLSLEVRKSNNAAIQLYQGLRFVITQIRRNFYSNGEDAYQMTLHLDSSALEF